MTRYLSGDHHLTLTHSLAHFTHYDSEKELQLQVPEVLLQSSVCSSWACPRTEWTCMVTSGCPGQAALQTALAFLLARWSIICRPWQGFSANSAHIWNHTWVPPLFSLCLPQLRMRLERDFRSCATMTSHLQAVFSLQNGFCAPPQGCWHLGTPAVSTFGATEGGDGSIGKPLAFQAWGLEFNPQNPFLKKKFRRIGPCFPSSHEVKGEF